MNIALYVLTAHLKWTVLCSPKFDLFGLPLLPYKLLHKLLHFLAQRGAILCFCKCSALL